MRRSKRASKHVQSQFASKPSFVLSLSLPSHVECSFTREVVGVPGNFEQRLVLGHDKPPSGARRAPSLLWRLQRNLPDEKPAHYLYPPRSSTRYYRGEGRREAELSLSAPLLIIRFLDMHTRACWPSSKTGQRAHLLVRSLSWINGTDADRFLLLLLLWLRFRQFPRLLGQGEEEFIVPKRQVG